MNNKHLLYNKHLVFVDWYLEDLELVSRFSPNSLFDSVMNEVEIYYLLTHRNAYNARRRDVLNEIKYFKDKVYE